MRVLIPAVALLLAVPAQADSGDELRPVSASALVGRPYTGAGAASEIEFINTRRGPVRLNWIGFDGAARFYAVIPPGGEILQPTFVSHRWLIQRADGGASIEAFIASRADIHSDGQPQIAIIR